MIQMTEIGEMIHDTIEFLKEADWQTCDITAELIQNQIEQLHGVTIEIDRITNYL